MPEKTDLSALNCSVAGALSIVGDWWSLLIVRDALLGVERFSEFRQSLGLARNILADRLRRLVADGILIREGSVARPRYRLSDKGRALAPTIVALMQWGDRWVSRGRPPVAVTDARDRPIETVALRAAGKVLGPHELRFHAGNGAKPATRVFLARMSERTQQS